MNTYLLNIKQTNSGILQFYCCVTMMYLPGSFTSSVATKLILFRFGQHYIGSTYVKAICRLHNIIHPEGELCEKLVTLLNILEK